MCFQCFLPPGGIRPSSSLRKARAATSPGAPRDPRDDDERIRTKLRAQTAAIAVTTTPIATMRCLRSRRRYQLRRRRGAGRIARSFKMCSCAVGPWPGPRQTRQPPRVYRTRPRYRAKTQAVDEVELTILLQSRQQFRLKLRKNIHSTSQMRTPPDVHSPSLHGFAWEGLRTFSLLRAPIADLWHKSVGEPTSQ